GSGSLLVPIDSQAELPTGASAVVARFLNGALNVNAFQSTPGPIHVTSDDVHSFTIDGRPLPPLIQVSDAGNIVFGTTDAAFSVTRVARVNAQGQPNFDLTYLPNFESHGPIVFSNADFAVGALSPVPLVEMKTSPAGAAFAPGEAIDGVDLNGDNDT